MFETSGDLVGLPDGYLYWTVVGDESDQLVRLDPNSGLFAPVGSLGYDQLYGLGYDEGELFGFSASGLIVAISPDSATTSLRSSGSLSGGERDNPWCGRPPAAPGFKSPSLNNDDTRIITQGGKVLKDLRRGHQMRRRWCRYHTPSILVLAITYRVRGCSQWLRLRRTLSGMHRRRCPP